MIHSTELSVLVAAVAASPIVVAAPAADFADWCARQKPDADAAIRAWLRSQSPARQGAYS